LPFGVLTCCNKTDSVAINSDSAITLSFHHENVRNLNKQRLQNSALSAFSGENGSKLVGGSLMRFVDGIWMESEERRGNEEGERGERLWKVEGRVV